MISRGAKLFTGCRSPCGQSLERVFNVFLLRETGSICWKRDTCLQRPTRRLYHNGNVGMRGKQRLYHISHRHSPPASLEHHHLLSPAALTTPQTMLHEELVIVV